VKVALIGELTETCLNRPLQIKLAHIQTNADLHKKGRKIVTDIPDFCELSFTENFVPERREIKN